MAVALVQFNGLDKKIVVLSRHDRSCEGAVKTLQTNSREFSSQFRVDNQETL